MRVLRNRLQEINTDVVRLTTEVVPYSDVRKFKKGSLVTVRKLQKYASDYCNWWCEVGEYRDIEGVLLRHGFKDCAACLVLRKEMWEYKFKYLEYAKTWVVVNYEPPTR